MSQIQNFHSEEYLGGVDTENKNNFKTKVKNFLESRYFVAVCVALVGVIAFFLGRISKIQETKEPVRIINNSISNTSNTSYRKEETETSKSSSAQNTAAVSASENNTTETVVASKNGTKYHYSWCAGAKQIAEKNKITFASIEDARAAGYTPAANCKGLK